MGINWSNVGKWAANPVWGAYDSAKPSVPNFAGLAEQDTMNNRPDITTPWGSQTWGVGPDGRPTMNYSLGGEAQNALTGLQGNMASAAGYDPTQARDQAISSNYNQALSRLNPQWEQAGQAFTSGMANQGLDPGMQGYDAAAGNFGRSQNDAYTSAMANAIRQGNETQQVGIQQSMLPFQQYSSLINASMQQPGFRGAASQLEAGKDKFSVQNAQFQDLLNLGMSGAKAAGAKV